MSTTILLAQDSSCIVIDRDGDVLIREIGKPNRPTPHDPQAFLKNARFNFGYFRVLGADGEENPAIPDGVHVPRFVYRVLPGGEPVYVIAPS
jgi:hypothetical protein